MSPPASGRACVILDRIVDTLLEHLIGLTFFAKHGKGTSIIAEFANHCRFSFLGCHNDDDWRRRKAWIARCRTDLSVQVGFFGVDQY